MANEKFENHIKNKAPILYAIWKAGKTEVTFQDGEVQNVVVLDWDEDSLFDNQEPQLICDSLYFRESDVKSYRIIS